MSKSYKNIDREEMETTVNVLYGEDVFSIYTNKPELERSLYKVLGEPKREDKKGKTILGSMWEVSLEEKSKITKILLKANIFEL